MIQVVLWWKGERRNCYETTDWNASAVLQSNRAKDSDYFLMSYLQSERKTLKTALAKAEKPVGVLISPHDKITRFCCGT